MKIQIKQKHVALGVPGNPEKNPIGLAIEESFLSFGIKLNEPIKVDLAGMTINGCRFEFFEATRKAVVTFNRTSEMDEFELNIL